MRRVLFGGSFDPFHNAHLAMVEACLRRWPTARCVLIPAASPPHKLSSRQLPFEHRLAMLTQLAGGLGERVEVSGLEARRPPPAYSIDTVRAFRATEPGRPGFLLGADSLSQLASWREYQALVGEARLIVVARPEVDLEAAFADLSGPLGEARVAQLRADRLEVAPSALSSTELRRRVAAGEELEGLIPEVILQYLERHRLLEGLARP